MPVPLRKSARSSRASIRNVPQERRASVLWLGGGRCAPATIRYALLSAFRSTFPARRPQTEAFYIQIVVGFDNGVFLPS